MLRFVVKLILIFVVTTASAQAIVGIIVPMPEEGAWLLKNISSQKEKTINGIRYKLGKIADKDIVFVNSGIGKVNAAAVSTRLINDFHPTLILLSGSAGNLNPMLKEGEVVVGKKVVDVDLGELTANGVQFKYSQYLKSPQTNSLLPLNFTLDEHVSRLIPHLDKKQLPKIILGSIATSDALPNPPTQEKLLQESKFDVTDMEGSAVMQVCWMFNVPCVVVRGVSNNVEDAITAQDIAIAADNAAKVAVKIISM